MALLSYPGFAIYLASYVVLLLLYGGLSLHIQRKYILQLQTSNAMLTSILYRDTPEDVRLILIDQKRLEIGMYADIPHLLTPVVVDPKQANNALRWAVREMEERYKHLAAEGVRSVIAAPGKVRR